MELQDQVCTLEQAKKLKELEVIQESTFSWWPIPKVIEGGAIECIGYEILQSNYKRTYGSKVKFSAFTVAELGVMLPSETLTIRRGSEYSECPNWEWENECHGTGWGCFNTEAEARADLLIMLLENKKVTVEEVNERLS